MKEKESPNREVSPSPAQPVAGSPEDLNKRAENKNPRANENIQEINKDLEESDNTVGSEITDGEDA